MTDKNLIEDRINISLNSANAILKPANSSIGYLPSFISNVSFDFPNILREDKNIVYSTVEIANAQIPVSFYQINYTNNVLNVRYINSTSSTTIIYTLTRGNYNITTLLAEIKTQTAGVFTGTFNKISGIITLTGFNPSVLNYTDFQILPSPISAILGFDNLTTYTSSANVLTAPFPVSLLTIKKLKICSSNLSTNSLDSSNGGKLNLIQTITVNAPPYGIITYENLNNRSVLTNNNINTIDIQILDDGNRFVNFNNVDWTIQISITHFRRIHETDNKTFEDLTRDILKAIPIEAPPSDLQTSSSLGINEATDVNPIFSDTADLDFYMYQHGIDI